VVSVEVLYPAATGVLLLPAAAFVYSVYRSVGFRPLLALAAGLAFVAVESFLDAYEASLLLRYGGWDGVPPEAVGLLLAVDTVRGVFIVAWAAAALAFTLQTVGAGGRLARLAPALVAAAGVIETVALNYSGIEPLSKRILLSSAVRVLGILVPVALASGAYLLARVWRETRSRSVLAWGLAFIVHGLTLPLYPLAKGAGPAALGLWYLFGGVVPAGLAALGALLLRREAAEATG